jgi:anti-sigma factor RsiW
MKVRGCKRCEELLQSYLDGELAEPELDEAEGHLDLCGYCRKRYRFERRLRLYFREVVHEPMPDELRARLSDLRGS